MQFLWLIPLLLSMPLTLHAQSAPAGAITTEQAVQESIEKNLSLLAERYNLNIAEARIITAKLRPNPVFSFGADYQDWLGAGFTPIKGIGPAEVNFRTDFILEAPGKRQSRIEVAKGNHEVARLQLLNTTRLLILDVQSACVDVLSAKDNLALAQKNLKVFNELVSVNTDRVRAGDLAQVELVRSRVAALQYHNAVIQAESRLRIARRRVQTLLGRKTETLTVDVAGELRRDGTPLGVEEVRRQALNLRPDLQAMTRDQARSLAEIRSQQAQGKVDYTIGTQVHRQYGDGLNRAGNSLGVFFSMPLPLFNRNQGEIARSRQEQQQILSRIQALQADIVQNLDSAYQQYQTAQQLLENIEKNMLQQASAVRETTEYSYRRGEASLIELLDAQRAFNDTMQGYNDARAEYARSLYLMDSIAGKGVNP